MKRQKIDVLEQAREWVDKNPKEELEFYCEEGVTVTNEAGLAIIDILSEDSKNEDDLIQMIAKVQWYRKFSGEC